MQVVTLSIFGFDGFVDRAWAFSQMGLARRAVSAMEGLTFHKQLGTGAGAGFSTRPDWSRYGLLCVWDNMDAAERAMDKARVVEAYRRHAAHHVTLYLETTRTRGLWDGREPFAVCADAAADGPIVALTRATLDPFKAIRFWRLVSSISDEAETERTQHFMLGLGEVPYLHQMTFSIWSDEAQMRRFSLASATHGEAVKRAYGEGWFRESLFARFNLFKVEGAWPGLDLVAIGAHAPKLAAVA